MSSVHADKGRLFISFILRVGGRRVRVRLYIGLRDSRENRRSALIKEVRELIEMRRWTELADRFPTCKPLAAFATASSAADVTTFEQASVRFLTHQSNVNKLATVVFYRTLLKTHVWPVRTFAEKPIKMIGASDVAAVYGAVNAKGHQAQAANVRRVISAVFNWAHGERGSDGEYLIKDNPVNRTRPVSKDNDDDRNPFNPDEVRRVLNAAKAGWERRLVTVAIGAGLDPGENFGLKRRDLNFDDRKIQIRQRFTRYGEGALKNRRRRREVDMSEMVFKALKEQSAAAMYSLWLWPSNRIQTTPHDPQNFSRRNWPAILKRAGVEHREFYQCRHTFASLLLLGGADWRYVADQMGHADLTMLQKHYWKWRPGSTARPQTDIILEALTPAPAQAV
jgi:integrase